MNDLCLYYLCLFRGAMGNLMLNPDRQGSVHGVLYRISHLDIARLTHMEHEYRQDSCQERLCRVCIIFSASGNL